MTTITRQEIINTYAAAFAPLDTVYAMWLEGADATGHLDKYSDIDINLDVADEAVEDVLRLAEKLFPLDLNYDNGGDDGQLQRVYHIAGTSEYWMIDFNVQLHSCNGRYSKFRHGDEIEKCVVLFDKAGVVRYVEPNPALWQEEHQFWLRESEYRFGQLCRVYKYTLRGQYPETLLYYNKYVVEPLVMLLRMRYTPGKLYYHMVHISQHIPAEPLARLNKLLQVSSCADIAARLGFAREWYRELRAELR